MKIVIWGVGTRGKRIFSRLMPGELLDLQKQPVYFII